VIEDHRGVVSGEGAVAVRAERLAELLDREILPRLERPSRLLGPFEGDFRTADGAPDIAWIWPSLAEGPDTPEALRPLFESALLPPEVRIGLACAPAPDVERALVQHGIPWFARPSLQPLADVPVWLVWLESPLQLLGLLSVFVGAGVDHRALRRGGVPRVILSGPGAGRIPELAAVHADAVVPVPTLRRDGMLASCLGSTPAAADGVVGARPAPDGPSLDRSGDEELLTPRGPRKDESSSWLVLCGTDALRRAPRLRVAGRGESFTEQVFVGSGSEAVRARHGLIDTEALGAAVAEAFADEAGAVQLDFVIGLPGETETDRASIGRLVQDVAAVAPRGARQVRVRVGCFVPDEGPAIAPAVAEATLEALRDQLPTKRMRVETVPPALAAIETLLRRAGAEAAPVLERVHHLGGRRADSDAALDPAVWREALGAGSDVPGAEVLEPVDVHEPTGVCAPTGFRAPSVETPEAAANGRSSRSRRRRSGRSGKKSRADRWTRWQALVPRQFDHRVEFAKRGRLRFLGAGEVTELFLRACARAEVPLATSGVAQPRPKLSFGPSLPTGIEGLAEVVDLGLVHRVPDLLERLRPHLPDDLQLHRMLFVPTHGNDVALSRVALTEYEARLAPSLWNDETARASSLARLEAWSRRIGAGHPCTDDPDDPINQLRDVRISEGPDDEHRLVFALDVRGPGSRCRPRDVLRRGLEEAAVDVRCIPLQRLRLLTIENDAGRERLVTPIEQARGVERRLRAKAKLCA
jgi:radical SAM-linked protein